MIAPSARSYVAQFFRAARVLRAPIFVSLFAAAVLGLLSQTREVYRVLADDYLNQGWQIAFAFTGLLLASGFVWHCARQATLVRRRHVLLESSVEGFLLRWLPRVLAALIPLGAAVGLFQAIKEANATKSLVEGIYRSQKWDELQVVDTLIAESPKRLWAAVLICVGLVAVVLVVTIARTRHRSWKYERPSKWLMGKEATISSLVIAAICVGTFSFASPSLPQAFGAVAIFALFIVVLAVVLTSIAVLGDTMGVPLLTCLAAWSILLGIMDLNENHTVQLVKFNDEKNEIGTFKPSTANLKRAFRDWYLGRSDRAYYAHDHAYDVYRNRKNAALKWYIDWKHPGTPYPVFIVAAAGGGAYAAYYTATFLARLQDRCPGFAQHTFAISGVSGGSLGATVFASLAKQTAKNGAYEECNFGQSLGEGPLEEKVQAIFSADFLSPVLAAGLFPDLLQRVVPVAIPSFDRSKALDATLEAAWRKAIARGGGSTDSSPLEKPFLDLWNPRRSDEAVPALILNTTEVATGYRTIISPLWLNGLPNSKWGKIASIYERLPPPVEHNRSDLKLSTAAGMSARFPIILPAASIDLTKPGSEQSAGTIRLVDGGYVESSAVDIANEILQVLKGRYRLAEEDLSPRNEPNVKFYLIVLMGYSGIEALEHGYGELSVPARALISTWGSRSDQAFVRAFAQNCRRLNRCYDTFPDHDHNGVQIDEHLDRARIETDVAAVFLNLRDFNLPLTWQLTEASRKIIGLHAGVAQRCAKGFTGMLTWTDDAWFRERREATRRRMRATVALEENNCSACLLQYKLAVRYKAPSLFSQDLCSPAATLTDMNPQ